MIALCGLTDASTNRTEAFFFTGYVALSAARCLAFAVVLGPKSALVRAARFTLDEAAATELTTDARGRAVLGLTRYTSPCLEGAKPRGSTSPLLTVVHASGLTDKATVAFRDRQRATQTHLSAAGVRSAISA